MDAETLAVDRAAGVPGGDFAARLGRLYPCRARSDGAGRAVGEGHRGVGGAVVVAAFGPRADGAAGRRFDHGGHAGGGDRRLSTIPNAAGIDVLFGPGAQRGFQRPAAKTRTDHAHRQRGLLVGA